MRTNRGLKFSDEEWTTLTERAEQEHLPVSTFVRKIVLDWLEQAMQAEREAS